MIFKEVLFITRNRRGKINRNGPKFEEMVNSSNPTFAYSTHHYKYYSDPSVIYSLTWTVGHAWP